MVFFVEFEISIANVVYVLYRSVFGLCAKGQGPLLATCFDCKADFATKCKLIRERVESRESETLGKWLTEDGLKKTGQFGSAQVKSIVSYCKKFPETLVRLGWMKIFHVD